MLVFLFDSVQKFAFEKSGGGFQSQRRSDFFGNSSSLLGQPPMLGGAGLLGAGMAPGAYGAMLLSAKRSLLSSSRYQRGASYRSNRMRTSHDATKDVDFTADVELGDSSPNGKDKRKSKREKFQPY